MSVKLMGLVWDRYSTGGGEMNLALKLADHAHDDGTHIYPGIASLAEKTRQSERTVFRQLQKMVLDGWLIPVKNGGGGRGLSVEYRINPGWIKGDNLSGFHAGDQVLNPDKLAGFADKETLTSEAQNPDIHDRNPDKSRTPILRNRQEPSENHTPLPPVGVEDAVDADFRTVVEAYPRTTNAGVANAREIWRQLKPHAHTVGLMLSAIERQRRSPDWQREDGRFIPKLSRWLREQRWLDTPPIVLVEPQALTEPVRQLTSAELVRNAANAAEARARLGLSPRSKDVTP